LENPLNAALDGVGKGRDLVRIKLNSRADHQRVPPIFDEGNNPLHCLGCWRVVHRIVRRLLIARPVS
jgi:hypothetical protein